ncbi:GNAT family N-acetyltransferase [Angustibacter aerolatus]
MSEVTVRALSADDWEEYRAIRLEALRDAPDAFSSSLDEEAAYDEAFWRLRMDRSARLLAELDGERVGVVSVGTAAEPGVSELFGMWVPSQRRGAGIAWRLTDAAARWTRRQGGRGLQLWVSTDNGRAVAFFSSYGFRPTDERRPMVGDDDVEELAMILPIGDDPGWVPTSSL